MPFSNFQVRFRLKKKKTADRHFENSRSMKKLDFDNNIGFAITSFFRSNLNRRIPRTVTVRNRQKKNSHDIELVSVLGEIDKVFIETNPA